MLVIKLPRQPELHENQIRSPILSRGTEGKYANNLATNSLHETKKLVGFGGFNDGIEQL